MILIVFSLFAFFLMVVYYKEKLLAIVSNRDYFLKLFFDATQISSLTTQIVLTFLGVSLISLLIELIFVGWSKSALKRLLIKPSKSALVDWFSYVLSVFKIFEFLSFILTLGFFYFLSSIMTKLININLLHFVTNDVLKFILLFIFIDFISYWRHRINHMKGIWELHLFHHSAKEFNLITTTRGSFFEAAFNTLFSTVVFVIMGAEVEAIIWLVYSREIYQHLLHSNLDWNLGWVGRNVLISPLAHKLHHSINPSDDNLNFGFVFNWWDKAFGTFKNPLKGSTILIGVEGEKVNKLGFFRAQFDGLIKMLKVFR